MKKKLPIGISDFRTIIEEGYYYVDKSLLIKELLDSGTGSTLIPRPRRFGKTLNMSMLRYFFEKGEEDRSYLFEGLEIWKEQNEYYKKYLGKYPVIYLSFKGSKYDKWEECIQSLRDLISNEYANHEYLLDSGCLKGLEKKRYTQILNGEGEDVIYSLGLGKLLEYLYRYHKEKVLVLIDEYDVPIQSAYFNKYYDQVINFLRPLLSGALKDNEYLFKGILTGILRVAKESIFTYLNNFEICSLINRSYSDKFGFIEEEVEEMLKYYDIGFKIEEVKDWYDGYVFGVTSIYNPWSILNFARKWEDGLLPYWINTSSNDLVRNIISRSTYDVKRGLEDLLKGNSIDKKIDDSIVFKEIESSADSIWSFLLMTGYLKIVKKYREGAALICSLKIPNEEVKYCYKNTILSWFGESINNEEFNVMLKSLVNGDIKTFSKIFKDFVIRSFSFFDTGGQNPEKVYHAFVLGLLLGLNDTYDLKSNRESGYGRYDIMLIPRDIKNKGIIIEFKTVDEDDKETLEKAAEAAMKQIEEKRYDEDLRARGIREIVKIGIAFEGKKVLINWKTD